MAGSEGGSEKVSESDSEGEGSGGQVEIFELPSMQEQRMLHEAVQMLR